MYLKKTSKKARISSNFVEFFTHFSEFFDSFYAFLRIFFAQIGDPFAILRKTSPIYLRICSTKNPKILPTLSLLTQIEIPSLNTNTCKICSFFGLRRRNQPKIIDRYYSFVYNYVVFACKHTNTNLRHPNFRMVTELQQGFSPSCCAAVFLRKSRLTARSCPAVL